ncbi:MAG: ornithine acetyltransferase [Candidatus Nephthysia bennettiae]|uniref:Arginine biosynthesis bifunctional protein ArgJ n=1 Tax=Candidatus Nephthysia bennettiae TaxID=3127016 RepID=A0A934K1S3_9BACT|nr:bifunctional glutamate N-acetyltransferase/amino-acid acetyltransferase ArgJ [Candidatus Dormibacteraeota bacterium]MBJ7613879.1 bifunctional glutamate N-acetyltransferase/amino-acid acetyltransferase ArgJ [Candidatus Dormibacteraeota bacterium]PZR95647.1 MAG: ornithine acetyltransferase [Candidatus Dormibacteraeota bacterium]
MESRSSVVPGGLTAPKGWVAGVAACGIKAFTAGASALPSGQREDLAVVASNFPCDSGGVFTTNRVKSASVVIDQLHLKANRLQALVVCSGNANACTGAQGFRDALQMAKLTSDQVDLEPNQVLVGTTGVIGRYLPMDAVKHGIREACRSLSPEAGDAAARAIMTTDTVPKVHALELELGGATVRVGGMAKGSGMIHPNMATMLAYVTTDAAVAPGWVASVVRSIADRSFNQVTVDGDSSTNDTFLIMANGAAGNPRAEPGSPEAEALEAAILEVARELARKIARDGEGATKLMTVRVSGAPDDAQARLAARAVASSNLVKSAIHGGDPNWGRIVCALGYSGSELAIDRLRVDIAGLTVFATGAGVDVDLQSVRRAFEEPEIEIRADLGLGRGAAEAWGCDLSEEYVRINADYTT